MDYDGYLLNRSSETDIPSSRLHISYLAALNESTYPLAFTQSVTASGLPRLMLLAIAEY